MKKGKYIVLIIFVVIELALKFLPHGSSVSGRSIALTIIVIILIGFVIDKATSDDNEFS